MHLFLTGEVRVGKSTIVQQVLQEYRGTVGGFRTILGPLMEDGGSDVFMIDINESRNWAADQKTGWPAELAPPSMRDSQRRLTALERLCYGRPREKI